MCISIESYHWGFWPLFSTERHFHRTLQCSSKTFFFFSSVSTSSGPQKYILKIRIGGQFLVCVTFGFSCIKLHLPFYLPIMLLLHRQVNMIRKLYDHIYFFFFRMLNSILPRACETQQFPSKGKFQREFSFCAICYCPFCYAVLECL